MPSRRLALLLALALPAAAADKPKHRAHRAHKAHAHKTVAEPAPAFVAPPVQVDAMVVAAVPGTLAELAAVGRELTAICDPVTGGTTFLEGPGPGIKLLAVDRVEPRVNEHLPWGEVGACRPDAYRILSRQKVVLMAGATAQVPLDESCVIEEPSHHEGVIKAALQIGATAQPDGTIRVTVARRRSVAFAHDLDPAAVIGGHLGTAAIVAEGQDLLVTGLGPSPVPHVAHEEPEHYHDPLDRFRDPRPSDRRRHRANRERGERHGQHAEECPGELIVRVLVRRAPPLR